MTCEDFLYLCSPAFFILFSFLQLLNLLLKIPAEAHLQVSIFAISSSLTQTKLDGHSHCATFYSEQWQTEKVLVNLFEIVIIFAILFGANNGINSKLHTALRIQIEKCVVVVFTWAVVWFVPAVWRHLELSVPSPPALVLSLPLASWPHCSAAYSL